MLAPGGSAPGGGWHEGFVRDAVRESAHGDVTAERMGGAARRDHCARTNGRQERHERGANLYQTFANQNSRAIRCGQCVLALSALSRRRRPCAVQTVTSTVIAQRTAPGTALGAQGLSTLRLPNTSSVQVNGICRAGTEAASPASDLACGLGRVSGMMAGCAVASDLSRRDQRLRGVAVAADERLGQGRGNPGPTSSTRSSTTATGFEQSQVRAAGPGLPRGTAQTPPRPPDRASSRGTPRPCAGS